MTIFHPISFIIGLMDDHLTIVNLPAGCRPLPVEPVEEGQRPYLVLKTCLRTLLVDLKYPSFKFSSNSFYPTHQDVLVGAEAYIYLLEVLCGLKSKILAETEIIGQFKEAYWDYLNLPNRNPRLIKILEKLLTDSKKIRHTHLRGIGQKSYSYLARKLLFPKNLEAEVTEKRPPQPVQNVLILGSGHLAIDLIHQLQKWTNLCISARNEEKVTEIKQRFPLEVVPWGKFTNYHEFSHIVCAIGTDTPLFTQNFFHQWNQRYEESNRLFIDFGSPSSIATDLQREHGVYRLADLFLEEQIHQQYKMQQIQMAHAAIRTLVEQKRFVAKFPSLPLNTQRKHQLAQ